LAGPGYPSGWFQSFFAEERPLHGCLPLTIRRWVRQELAAFQSDALSVRPPQPLVVRRGEKRLYLRFSNAGNEFARLLFLRVEDQVAELAKLRPLGLGPRATEVLYWVMQGKTNEEIGIILQVSARTIEKHLENILATIGRREPNRRSPRRSSGFISLARNLTIKRWANSWGEPC
jgi:hypothetical protein